MVNDNGKRRIKRGWMNLEVVDIIIDYSKDLIRTESDFQNALNRNFRSNDQRNQTG